MWSPRLQCEQVLASNRTWRALSSCQVKLVAPAVASCLDVVKLNVLKCPAMMKPLASKDETMAALMPVPESQSARVRVDSLEEQPLVVKYLTLNCPRHLIWQSLQKAEPGSKVSVVLTRVASLSVPVRMLYHLLWGKRIRDEICNPGMCTTHFDISYRVVSCGHPLSPLSAT